MRETIVCTDITSVMRNTKYGEKPAYDMLGNTGEKFQCGFTNPNNKGIHPGTTFTAEVTRGGQYGPKINLNTVQLVGAGDNVPPPATPDPVSRPQNRENYQKKVFPVPPTHGDIAIIRQNSLARAVELVTKYIEMPDEAQEEEFLADVAEMALNLAARFADYSSGATILAQMKAETTTE